VQPESNLIRILIADDNRAMRESVAELIGRYPDMKVTGQASDGAEALEKVSAEKFDLVILDVSIPVMNGLDVLRAIKQSTPHLPVIMLSVYPAEVYETLTYAFGAACYITKDRAEDELIDEIRRHADIPQNTHAVGGSNTLR
jgi:two-component system invasion response regulator UvrY